MADICHARIIKAIADVFTIECDNDLIDCKARGNFRHNKNIPLVGDFVDVDINCDGTGVILKINERKNQLLKPPVANIDYLYIVISADNPKPNKLLIDRVSVIAEEKSIEPVFVFNKTDLADISGLESIYSNAGYKTHKISCYKNIGIEDFIAQMPSGVVAFTGNTGVGKSSILNKISPDITVETGEISKKLGRGKHTTRHTEMFRVSDNTYVIDTPGFSSFNDDEIHFIHKENIQFDFKEFSNYIGTCKFTSCTHTVEKGCSIIEAVNNGEISKERFESYLSIYSEASSLEEWKK